MASVISFRIDDEDRAILEAYAKGYDATISWAARRAVKEFTTKLTKENKDEVENYLFAESDVGTCEDGVPSGGDTTKP